MKSKIAIFLLCAIAPSLFAQGIRETDNLLPLRRVIILTSGLAHYEYSGTLSGPANIPLLFRLDAVNDALKTLVINDPASANPSVTYQSEHTLFHTLRSLQIDISDEPTMALILSRLRGAEAEITFGASTFTGRITGIEHRTAASQFMHTVEPWLMLNTTGGIRLFNLNEVNNIRFLDAAIQQDLNRALDLIASSRNSNARELLVNLPGTGRRNVSISYVIPSPVWKVSYRLDLGAERPVFQGWAIVDNDSDSDWNNVELSLVAGRPASFIQNLFPPFYVWRPTLPLAIAGAAEAAVHDRTAPPAFRDMSNLVGEQRQMMMDMAADEETSWRGSGIGPAPQASPARPPVSIAGGAVETAAGADAGGQFAFTIRHPVTLARRMSAMLPLVESQIQARSLLIYSGTGRHPRLGAEITNTTGMRLPAGPVTVYDGGVYAGSALLEFWNENETRLISFGEDLSVTADVGNTSTRTVESVNVSGGVMTINRNMIFSRTYTFINSSAYERQLIVEHPITPNTELVSPAAAEQTATIYRFNVTLPPNRMTTLTVNERRPLLERVTLLTLRTDGFISFATNHEIPPHVREALQRAVELRRVVDAAEQEVRNIEAQRSRVIADQDRTRRNLEAVGIETQQGQEFLRRLVSLDSEIDALASSLERAHIAARAAQAAYESYIAGLNL